MQEQKSGLLSTFITNRMLKAKVIFENNDIDFNEFENLLDFDNTNVDINLEFKRSDVSYNNETMVLVRTNFLGDKKSFTTLSYKEDSNHKENIKETVIDTKEKDSTNKVKEMVKLGSNEEPESKTLDFSMFEALLEEFNPKKVSNSNKKTHKQMKNTNEKIIKYLKKEIKYYEKKIDTDYSLNNLEIKEDILFNLKERINSIKTNFDELQKNVNVAEKFEGLMKECKNEILSLEQTLQNNDLHKINSEFNYDIKLDEFESKIKIIDENINNNICFSMIKRMMFNLFKMNVGIYTIEISKDDYKKLTFGSFLVINSIIGIREAINLRFNKNSYYRQSDFSNDLDRGEAINLSNKLLNESLINIEKLKDEFKSNFSNYKNYIDDYEEVYFKIFKLKDILDHKQVYLKEIIDNLQTV